MCESSSVTSKIINLPLLSKIHFSTLQSSFGFMSIITPLLFVVPWLKRTLPPHSADHASALSFELCVSWRNVKCTFWLWIHLKTDRRFIDLLRPLVLMERHLMSRLSIVFVLKGVKTFANAKRQAWSAKRFWQLFFVLRDWGNLHIWELRHISAKWKCFE